MILKLKAWAVEIAIEKRTILRAFQGFQVHFRSALSYGYDKPTAGLHL